MGEGKGDQWIFFRRITWFSEVTERGSFVANKVCHGLWKIDFQLIANERREGGDHKNITEQYGGNPPITPPHPLPQAISNDPYPKRSSFE